MAPVGTLADFIEVSGAHEGVVDEFLREELNYVVVESWVAAERASSCSSPAWMAAPPS
jgi:chromosome segregation protein